MKNTIQKVLILSILGFFQTDAFASSSKDVLEYECKLTAQSEDFLWRKLEYQGVIKIDSTIEQGSSYLTLQPISSIEELTVSARVLLTYFDGKPYFPMSLHPQNDTSRPHAHADFTGMDEHEIFHDDRQNNVQYTLKCSKI